MQASAINPQECLLNAGPCAQGTAVCLTQRRVLNATTSAQCTAVNTMCRRPTTHNARQRTAQEADNAQCKRPATSTALCKPTAQCKKPSARRRAVCSMETPSASCWRRIAPFGAVGRLHCARRACWGAGRACLGARPVCSMPKHCAQMPRPCALSTRPSALCRAANPVPGATAQCRAVCSTPSDHCKGRLLNTRPSPFFFDG